MSNDLNEFRRYTESVTIRSRSLRSISKLVVQILQNILFMLCLSRPE